MHWLFPSFLAGATAVGLPILLHLLRRRPKRTVLFPTLRFLAVTQQQNSKSQRLRRWLVLLLRCAALTLLAAAFARPFFGANLFESRRAIVVVIDNSFSLQAGQRWSTLRQWARGQIGPVRATDKIGLLVTGPRPTWLAPLSTSGEAALVQFDKLVPGWESARTEPALRLATDTLAATAADRRQVIFLGDHQRSSWAGFNFSKKLPPGVTAAFPDLPPPVARQAALRLPAITRTPEGFRAMIPIQNYAGAHPRTLRIYRDDNSTAVQQKAVTLAEHEAQMIQLDLPAGNAADTARFRFTLDADDLPADDEAYAVWQAGGERVVLLDPPPGGVAADYLASALASTATLEPTVQVISPPAAAWPAGAVAVLRNDGSFVGEAAVRLGAFLRGGGSAVLFIGGGSAQATWLGSVGIKLQPAKAGDGSLTVRDWAMDNVLVTAMAGHSVTALLNWNFRRGWSLSADTVDPIALWPDGGAAIGEANVLGGHLLLCGFAVDRRDSEWPVREMFVPFVHRAVGHLLGGQTGVVAKPARVGEPLALPGDTGTWKAVMGPASNLPAIETRGAVTPAAPGVYEFSHGVDRRWFAVNLVPEESDLAPWSEGTPWLDLESRPSSGAQSSARAPIALASLEAEQRAPLWWWLLAAVAVLSLAELALANRTTR